MKKRALRLLKLYLLLLGIGLAYAMIFSYTGMGIPCIIRVVTGFRCPGCGVSHMCVSLLHGHLEAAYYNNRAVFLLSPLLIIEWIRYMYRYIVHGTTKLKKADNVIIGICILVLIAWGIIRNLPGYGYLN